ncbi:N2227-like protein-domain-containing protein, partial [Kalaharituber pfeilii]
MATTAPEYQQPLNDGPGLTTSAVSVSPEKAFTRSFALLLTCLALLLGLLWPQFTPSNGGHNQTTMLSTLTSKFLSPHLLTSAPPPQTPSEAHQTTALLSRLTPTQLSARTRTYNALSSTPAVRARLLTALSGYLQYRNRSLAFINRKRKGFAKLSEAHKALLELSGVDYESKMGIAADRVRRNAELVDKVLVHVCAYYGVSRAEVELWIKQQGTKNAGEHTSVTQALKHLVRDFSDEGARERGRVFEILKRSLGRLFPEGENKDGREGRKVLVPGSGVGGLVWEIAGMGFEVTGVEWSFYVASLAHFVGSAPVAPSSEDGKHELYPYIEWWSHHITTANMTRAAKFPFDRAHLPPPVSSAHKSNDAPPLPKSHPAHRVTLLEEDFTLLHQDGEFESYDAIVTLFFLDTAQNIVQYIKKIHEYLKPGGFWVNLGPFLYGTSPWIELSLGEVIEVAEAGLGFEFVRLLGGEGEEGKKWEEIW